MNVEAAVTVQQVRELAALPPGPDEADLSALQSFPEVLGFVIACARAEGEDEVEWIDLFVRAAETPRDDLRHAQTIMRKLGYRAVADRLRQLARRKSFKPKK